MAVDVVATEAPSLRRPGDIVPVAASRYGRKTALVTPGRTLTYDELDELSSRLAASLRASGVKPGERVSLYAENRWEWIVAYHAILRAGCVVNPLNVMLTPTEVAYAMQDCDAAAMFGSATRLDDLFSAGVELPYMRLLVSFEGGTAGAASFGELLDLAAQGVYALAGRAASDPLCTIAYTSGTTGHPKGAMQSHDAVLLNCALTATMHVRTSSDVVVTALPAPHVYGNVVINSTFLAGGTVVLLERFDPAAALDAIVEHRATMFEGVPAMYAMMLAQPDVAARDLSSLTRCTVGGQTIAKSTVESWESITGAPLLELWGMTELAGLGTTHALYAPNVRDSIGVALPGVELRVASFDDPSRTMATAEPGELMVRGPLVMLGYYGNERATAETIEPDGWLHTGDVAIQDDRGYVFIVDRRKDVIITGGYNIYPAEIERVIASHPAVAMVAVGRQPDETKGELARAYVVLHAGQTASQQDIIDHCRVELATYKVPRSVRFVDDLPKTSTGKIMRRELTRLD